MNSLPPEAQSFFIIFGVILLLLALALGCIAWIALRDDSDPYEKCEREKEHLLAGANRELERRTVLNFSTERTS